MSETLAEFADSLNYGSRTNLNFKWLPQLGADGVAAFLAELLDETMVAVDSGDTASLARLIQQAQVGAYRPEAARRPEAPPKHSETRFTPLSRAIAHSSLALVTTSGHFVKGNDPAPLGTPGMTSEEATSRVADFMRSAPVLSEIPVDTPDEALDLLHPGYDPRPARQDPGIVHPLRMLRALVDEGRIGHVVDPSFSFIGAAAQKRIINDIGPRWAEKLAGLGADAALLIAVCPVCHLSIGHLALALEARGVATVVVFVEAFEHVATSLHLPRVLVTRHPMGRTLGAPHDNAGQRDVLRAAVNLFGATRPVVHRLERTYR